MAGEVEISGGQTSVRWLPLPVSVNDSEIVQNTVTDIQATGGRVLAMQATSIVGITAVGIECMYTCKQANRRQLLLVWLLELAVALTAVIAAGIHGDLCNNSQHLRFTILLLFTS